MIASWTRLLVPLLAALVAAGDPTPSPNPAILKFARDSLGKTIGDGECTSLALAALRQAGARGPADSGDGSGDYAWGRLVATWTPADHPTAAVRPGDIVQFRDVKLVTVSRSRGAIRTETATYPHHTAIVAAVAGPVVKVIHQNVGRTEARKRLVQAGMLRLENLKSGTMWVYRPLSD
jgi:hypothetical protein